MYNRYIPNGTSYTRITEQDSPPPPPKQKKGGKKSASLTSLLHMLKLEDLDTGDVLLLLILLLLLVEGDSTELVIALGSSCCWVWTAHRQGFVYACTWWRTVPSGSANDAPDATGRSSVPAVMR